MVEALIRYLNQLAAERYFWQNVRTLLRAAWLVACLWCIGFGGHLVWGWPLRPRLFGLLSLAVVSVALVVIWRRRRLPPGEVARRLDRRFRLHEQLSTAVEAAAGDRRPVGVAAHLVAQANRISAQLYRHLHRRQRPPWTEIITLASLALILGGLGSMVGIGRADPVVEPLPLPPLADAPAPPDQLLSEAPQQRGEQAVPQQDAAGGATAREQEVSAIGRSGDPRVLEAVADALRDQGVTRPAAEALDRGDVARAAEELRALADQAGQLSQTARRNLADALREAAGEIQGSDAELAEQLRRSAEGLERGGEEASAALEDLARALEQMQQAPRDIAGQPQGDAQSPQAGAQQAGQSGQGQGQAQGQPGGAGSGEQPAGEQRQAGPTDRLGVEGQPLELGAAGDESGRVPAEASDRPPTRSGTAPGITRGSANSERDGRVQTGADPLRVPLGERDVVQGYFTP